MNKIALIIGYGSAGQRHARLLKKNKKISKIYIFSSSVNIPFNKINKLYDIKKINPDIVIISTYSSKHLSYIKFLDRNLKNKVILIEKPLFDKFYSKEKKFINNKYYVGYNLRFHPIIKFLKAKLKKRKLWSFKVVSNSFLPNWRKNIQYHKSASALKKYGGGALLELSHEIDFTNWILGDFKILFSINKKISDLKINTDDQYEIFGANKKCKLINISTNFYSKIKKREIYVDCKNLSISANFLNNKVNLIENNKAKTIYFNNFTMNNSFQDEHEEIITKKFNNICTYKQGNEIMNYINQVKKNS